MARVTLRDLSFAYPGAAAPTIHGLQLDIADGEAHALLGASGAGKTTLLNLLSGLLVPDAGQVEFDGRDVSALPGRARRVAQVFQFPVLYDAMSVADNLAFPLRNAGLPAREIAQRTDYVADELELQALLGRRVSGLSLFEKQLVAVGKALARPDVALVLLDEPLTAVEPRIKWRLRQTLRRVQADLGVTMVYVTHDQTEALTFADRVSVLTAQGILQTGSPQDIYAEPAHEFVGHFVGSPGMNFVPADALGLQGQRAGFRPEWVDVVDDAALRGVVVGLRPQGTRQGGAHGITSVRTVHGDIHVRGPLRAAAGAELSLRVRRYVLFEDQLRVGSGELR